MGGQVQIVYDAETAPAVNELFKLAEAQKKVEQQGKRVAHSMGEVSKANMHVGKTGKEAGQSMFSGLAGTIGVAGGAIAAIGGIAAAWDKSVRSIETYNTKIRELALLQDVKGTPKLKQIIENQKRAQGVSNETKYGLFAGLQSELSQDQALKEFKNIIQVGAILPGGKAQEFGQLYSKIKSLSPDLKSKDVLNASYSIFQNLRGNIGSFDQKQVEKLLASGAPLGEAISTVVSFGRTSQGGEAIGKAINALDENRTFAPFPFAHKVTPDEMAIRDFYKMNPEGRRQLLFSPGNESVKRQVLGEQSKSFGIGLQEVSAMNKQLHEDVLENRVAKQLKYLVTDPEMKSQWVDMLTNQKMEASAVNDPFMSAVIPEGIRRWSARKGVEQTIFSPGPGMPVDPEFRISMGTPESDTATQDVMGSRVMGRSRGPELDRLIDALDRNTIETKKNTDGGTESWNGHNE